MGKDFCARFHCRHRSSSMPSHAREPVSMGHSVLADPVLAERMCSAVEPKPARHMSLTRGRSREEELRLGLDATHTVHSDGGCGPWWYELG